MPARTNLFEVENKTTTAKTRSVAKPVMPRGAARRAAEKAEEPVLEKDNESIKFNSDTEDTKNTEPESSIHDIPESVKNVDAESISVPDNPVKPDIPAADTATETKPVSRPQKRGSKKDIEEKQKKNTTAAPIRLDEYTAFMLTTYANQLKKTKSNIAETAIREYLEAHMSSDLKNVTKMLYEMQKNSTEI